MELEAAPIKLSDSNLSLSAAHDAAEQVAQRLRSLSLSTGPLDADTYFYTRVRVKSRPSILEKVSRQQAKHDDPYYSFRDLTDLVGFRIVTLFDDQLEHAILSVLRIVHAGRKLSQPLFEPAFIWNSFHDARFIRRETNDGDIYKKCHVAFCKNVDAAFASHSASAAKITKEMIKHLSPCENKTKEKYSSAHITFLANSYIGSKLVLIPVEFQIRSVSEDIWAEINHKFLYKLQNPYAWNLEFHDKVNDAIVHSGELKDKTDALSIIVEQFRAASKAALRKAEVFRAPNSDYNFSYVISMFYELGRRYTGDFAEHIIKHKTNMARLLTQTINNRASAVLIGKSIEEMYLIHEVLRDQKNARRGAGGMRSHEDDGEDVARILVDQKLDLIRFEIIRLKAIMGSYTGYKFDNKNKTVTKISSKDDGFDVYSTLYAELCDVRNSDTAKIHPLSVLYFWKYLVAQMFDDAVAYDNLISANDHIDDDATVPEWSIYHVLIPNRLAAEQFREALVIDGLRERLATKGSMKGMDREIRDRVTNALRLAIKAFNKHKVYDPKRGDLIFRSEEHANPLREGLLVLEIVKAHNDLFPNTKIADGAKARYAGQSVKELIEIVRSVEAVDKSEALMTTELEGSREKLVKEVRGILRIE